MALGVRDNAMGNCNSEEEDARPTHAFNSNLMRERKNRDVFKYYEVERVLGEGSMGAVSSVRKKESAAGGSAYKDSGTHQGVFAIFHAQKKKSPLAEDSIRKNYAMKTIQLGRVTDEFIEELRNEIDILKTLDHPNIVKAFEVFENKRQIFIIMEECSGGDLYARQPYSEKDAARIVGKLLSAIAYMHERKVVHRDLKFENIMFENKNPDAEIKVIDFGLSKKFLPGDNYMTEGVGTIYTMAPQVLQGVYTSQADLWSVGVITYMLLSSTKPFYHRKRRFVIDKIMRCDYNFDRRAWEHISTEGKQFVSSLIKLDPNERLTAQEALEHLWLSNEFPLSDRAPTEEIMIDVEENILNYKDASEFKKLALMVIAHKSSTEEIAQLRRAFDQYDSSNDGQITYNEFKEALSKADYTEKELESMFSSVDIDGDGVIHYTEFLAATLEIHGHIEEDRLAEAFDRIDSDDTGYISKKNLETLLGTDYSQERVNELFNSADLDSNGQISFEEFMKVFRDNNKRVTKKVTRMDTTDSEAGSELLGLDANIPGGKKTT